MSKEPSVEVRELLDILRVHFEESAWKDLPRLQGDELSQVRDLIERDRMSGLWLAYRSEISSSAFAELLREALRSEDASHVRWWLVAGIALVGCSFVLEIVGSEDVPKTNALLGALYWMPQLLPDDAPELDAQLETIGRRISGST